MTTPAEELRAAAVKLRRLAGQADDGPWETTWRGQEYHLDGHRDGELTSISEWTYAIATWEPKVEAERADCDTANPDYIAAMHPGVGLALASWLMAESAISAAIETTKAEYSPQGVEISVGLSTFEQALAVARQINGGPS